MGPDLIGGSAGHHPVTSPRVDLSARSCSTTASRIRTPRRAHRQPPTRRHPLFSTLLGPRSGCEKGSRKRTWCVPTGPSGSHAPQGFPVRPRRITTSLLAQAHQRNDGTNLEFSRTAVPREVGARRSPKKSPIGRGTRLGSCLVGHEGPSLRTSGRRAVICRPSTSRCVRHTGGRESGRGGGERSDCE